MNTEAGREFAVAIDAMSIMLPAMVEWANTLEGNESKEMLFHINKLTEDFRIMMAAVADYSGVDYD